MSGDLLNLVTRSQFYSLLQELTSGRSCSGDCGLPNHFLGRSSKGCNLGSKFLFLDIRNTGRSCRAEDLGSSTGILESRRFRRTGRSRRAEDSGVLVGLGEQRISEVILEDLGEQRISVVLKNNIWRLPFSKSHFVERRSLRLLGLIPASWEFLISLHSAPLFILIADESFFLVKL